MSDDDEGVTVAQITITRHLTANPDDGPPIDLAPAHIERADPRWDDDGEMRLGFRGSRSSGGLRRRDAATGRFITPRTDESEATT